MVPLLFYIDDRGTDRWDRCLFARSRFRALNFLGWFRMKHAEAAPTPYRQTAPCNYTWQPAAPHLALSRIFHFCCVIVASMRMIG